MWQVKPRLSFAKKIIIGFDVFYVSMKHRIDGKIKDEDIVTKVCGSMIQTEPNIMKKVWNMYTLNKKKKS